MQYPFEQFQISQWKKVAAAQKCWVGACVRAEFNFLYRWKWEWNSIFHSSNAFERSHARPSALVRTVNSYCAVAKWFFTSRQWRVAHNYYMPMIMYSNRDSVLMDRIYVHVHVLMHYERFRLCESRNNWIKFKIDKSIDIMIIAHSISIERWNFKWHLWIRRLSICHITSNHRDSNRHTANKLLNSWSSVMNPRT